MTSDKWRSPPKKPYEPRDSQITSSAMAKVKSEGNRTEVLLRKELFRRGLRYRLYDRRLPGKPDIVFPGNRLVVFVDGDFWHGRPLVEHGEEELRKFIRGRRADWWIAKIWRTANRDTRNTQALQDSGWKVLRLWESDVKRDIVSAADQVQSLINSIANAEH